MGKEFQRWSSFEEEEEEKKEKEKKEKNRKLSQRKTRLQAIEQEEQQKDETFDYSHFNKRLIFGSLVGFTSGATFGIMEGLREYSKQSKLSSSFNLRSNLHLFTHPTAKIGSMFSGFFCAYQGIKTLLEYQRKQDDIVNVAGATIVASLPFLRSSLMHRNAPYAVLLIGLDYFHEDINSQRK